MTGRPPRSRWRRVLSSLRCRPLTVARDDSGPPIHLLWLPGTMYVLSDADADGKPVPPATGWDVPDRAAAGPDRLGAGWPPAGGTGTPGAALSAAERAAWAELTASVRPPIGDGRLAPPD
ncbi:MAG: hypothetical protein V7637_6534 [Mycobacteriales bacterium]